MIMGWRIVAGALLLISLAGTGYAAEEIPGILAGLKNRYGSLSGMNVPYTREVITRTMTMLPGKLKGDTAEGTLFFMPPFYFKLDQQKPEHEVLVSDGEKIWWFVPLKSLVTIYPFRKFGKEFILLSDVLRGLSEVGERFLTALVPSEAGKDTYGLELRPEPPWEDIDRIILTITRDFRIAVVTIHHIIGGITRFERGELKAQSDFPDGFFKFTAPQGVKVVQEGD
jgi:outer membrane lipoprotein-sorting protein